MKALVFLILVGLVILTAYVVVGMAYRRLISKATWKVIDRPKGGWMVIYLERYGEQPQEFRRISTGDPEYDDKYTAAMFDAEQRAALMNANRKVISR